MQQENAFFSPQAAWTSITINSTETNYCVQKKEKQTVSRIYSQEERKQVKNMSERVLGFRWRILAALLYSVYTWFPLNTTSRIVGRLASIKIPNFLRVAAIRSFSWIFGVCIEECEFHDDLRHYTSISHFFRRRLLPGVRPVDPIACLTSPADGKVISCGKVEEGYLEQVKGLAYTLQALLGPNSLSLSKSYVLEKNKFNLPPRPRMKGPTVRTNQNFVTMHNTDPVQGASRIANPPIYQLRYLKSEYSINEDEIKPKSSLYHCAIYLSPGDYHCFHSPADWSISLRRHFPGRLFSVCSLVTSWLNGVFCINERAVYKGEWEYGFFAFVAVGATNVGSIHIFNDPHLVTNHPSYLRYLFSCRGQVHVNPENVTVGEVKHSQVPVITKMDGYEDLHFPVKIKSMKGEIFGEFNFGSTIVIIFEAPRDDFEFSVKVGDKIQVGRSLGYVKN